MEAGYDYLLLRKHLQHRLLNFSAVFIFVLGAMLLASSGVYYGYSAKARADLGTLNFTPPDAEAGSVQAGNDQSLIPQQGAGGEAVVLAVSPSPHGGEATGPANAQLMRQISAELESGSAPAGGESAKAAGTATPTSEVASPERVFPASAIGSQQLYPGESLLGKFWSDPFSYESAAFREQALLQGFTPVDAGLGLPLGSVVPATRIIVPSIDVDSRVSELAILDLGGSRAYETPKHTVGHIPETANAGESGSSWFFGHTESPILGEGSVFFNLSKIPGMLQDGKDVFVVTDNGENQYLYRISSSRVVNQRDMRLQDTGQATIYLVSCVPRLVYDHRLIVSGELVGQK